MKRSDMNNLFSLQLFIWLSESLVSLGRFFFFLISLIINFPSIRLHYPERDRKRQDEAEQQHPRIVVMHYQVLLFELTCYDSTNKQRFPLIHFHAVTAVGRRRWWVIWWWGCIWCRRRRCNMKGWIQILETTSSWSRPGKGCWWRRKSFCCSIKSSHWL